MDTITIKERYIPKKYWSKIESIYIEADFDYDKNRSYQHYFIAMSNGERFDSSSINDLKNKLKLFLGE